MQQSEKRVERKHISQLTERSFSSQYRCRKPVLIEGFMDAQPDEKNLTKVWTDEFLCARLRSADTGAPRAIEAFRSRDNMHFVDQADVVERVPMSFDRMLSIISQPPLVSSPPAASAPAPDAVTAPSVPSMHTRYYYRDLLFPELQAMVPHPTQLLYETTAGAKGFSRPLQMLWVGVQGCITSLHYDRCHGFLVQVRGKKRVRLFPYLFRCASRVSPASSTQVHLFAPKYTPNVYPHASVGTKAHLARVSLTDLRDPTRREETLRRFPLLAKAKPRVTDLNAGEILYIPPGHWHEVETLENSISVTIPWDLRPEEQPPRHMYA